MQTLSKEDVAAIAQTVVTLQQAQAQTAVESELVSFFPGTTPSELDRKTLCRSALAGRGCERDYSAEEQDAWQRGQPLSRHQLTNRPQIIHYDAVKARERAKAGTNTQCPNCGKPRN